MGDGRWETETETPQPEWADKGISSSALNRAARTPTHAHAIAKKNLRPVPYPTLPYRVLCTA
jgi:hypothetical protein